MVSIIIIASNSENTIKKCLDSVKDFEDVVVYLNNSNDKTAEICKKYKNVNLIEGYFDGYGPTKNRAVSFAKNDWVFILDSDEFMSQDLVEELKKKELNKSFCYMVNRKNLFLGEEVKYSGWSPDWIVRLFNRKITKFSNVEVHESVIAYNLKIQKLGNVIYHFAVNDVRDFLVKTYKYSNLKRKNNKTYHPLIIFFKSLFAFVKTYFIKLGFLDGYKGLVIAVGNFNGVFFKYMVNYVRKKKK